MLSDQNWDTLLTERLRNIQYSIFNIQYSNPIYVIPHFFGHKI